MESPEPTPGHAGTGVPTRLSLVHALGMLGVVCFVTHFLFLSQFGLYEDDYFYTLPVFGWDWSTWWIQFKDAIIHPIQGRPLNHALRRTLFFLSLNHGGLQIAYFLSWGLVTINALLVFTFVRRALSDRAALVAALLYVVYPIDTARQMLMHQTDLIFGAFILLVALNLYARGRRITGFAVAALSLINYESFYLPFLAAPLLLAAREPVSWRRLLGHGVTFFGIAGGVLLARKLLGESRAAEMVGGLGDVIGKMLAAGPIGVWQSLKAIGLRPVDAFLHAAPYAWILGLGLGILILSYIVRNVTNETSARAKPLALAWIAVGGIVAWLISYLLSFREGYYPPIVSIGRLTGVHSPGTFGAAMVAALLAELVGRSPLRALRVTSALVFAGLIGFSVSFGLQIQQSEYATHWTKQLAFHQRLIELVSDLREGELVVLDAEGDANALPITQGFPRFGIVNYTPLAFAKYVTWPSSWRTAPQIAVLWNECPAKPVPGGLALLTPPWRHPPATDPAALPKDVPVARDGALIYLTVEDGTLRRISGPVTIRGHVLNARAPSTNSPPTLNPSPLLEELAIPFDLPRWFTLRDARNYPK